MKSLAELIELAVLFVFGLEKHENVNVAYAAEDGNVFTDENRAKIHVKGKEMKYHTITSHNRLDRAHHDPPTLDCLNLTELKAVMATDP